MVTVSVVSLDEVSVERIESIRALKRSKGVSSLRLLNRSAIVRDALEAYEVFLCRHQKL